MQTKATTSRFAAALLAFLALGATVTGCGSSGHGKASSAQPANPAGSPGAATTAPSDVTDPSAGPSQPAEDKPEVDPCTLVTREEVTKMIGRPVTQVKPPAEFSVTGCEFRFKPRGPYSLVDFVSVNVHGDLFGLFEKDKHKADENVRPVAGLGDDAYGYRGFLGGREVDVRHGEQIISIAQSWEAKDAAAADRKLAALAAKALSRL